MPLYSEGFGTALGNALGGATTNYLQTQNTLKLQDQQYQQTQADNAYRDQQAAEQRRQFGVQQDTARLTRTTDLRNQDMQVLAPQMNTYMKQMQDLAQQYGPQSGPAYSPALYESYKKRAQSAQQAWSALSNTITSGQGYEEARTGLANAIGIGQPGAPVPGTPAGSPTPAPMDLSMAPAAPQVNYSFPVPTSPAGVAPAAAPPAAPALPPAAAGPVTAASLPESVKDIPASDLSGIPDAAILAKYGEDGLQYASSMRSTYYQMQIATRQAAFKAQNDMWDKVINNITNDKEHPATPAQLKAASVITTYGSLMQSGQKLNDNQQAEYSQAITSLAPLVYTPQTWQAILATKDPNVISQAYNNYAKVAPDIVQGFDPAPFVAAAKADLDEKHSAAYQQTTQGDKNVADAAKFSADAASKAQEDFLKGLLNGETRLSDVKDVLGLTALADNPNALNALGLTREAVQQRLTEVQTGVNQGLDKGNADLNATLTGTAKTGAEIPGVVAATNKTVAEVLGVKVTQGTALLGQLASIPPDLNYDQIAKQYPGAVYQLKQAFGMKDAGAENLIRQAQAVYGQGFRGKDLANQLASSTIQTQNATRGEIVARTADTQSTTRARDAKLQPDLDLLNQQIKNAQLAGQDTASLITRRNALLPYDVQQAQANVGATNANTQTTVATLPGKVALQGAQLANFNSEISSRNVRDQGYLDSVKNTGAVDLARVNQMVANTALSRAKNPNDVLYNPLLAATGKASDPMTVLKNRAALNYKSADEALRQAGVLQTQINGLKPKTDSFGNTTGGGDPAKIAALTKQMDTLTQRALNQRNAGDKVITDGLQNPAVNPPAGTPNSSIGTGQYQAIASSVTPGAGERPQETRFLNALRGAEGNPNYGLVTESSGNTQQDRATALGKLRRWSTEYASNSGHFAGMNPSKAPPISGGDFTPAFVRTFSNVYAPQGVANDPTNLNANHAGNLMGFMTAGGWNAGGQTPKVTTTGTKSPAVTAAPPKSAGAPLPVVQTTPAPAAQTPGSVKPQGSVGPYMGKLASSGWITRAQNAKTAAEADSLLNGAARMVMPNGSPAQIALLKRDLSLTMGF